MRVNQQMLVAAAAALGYDVDAERVQKAYNEQAENYDISQAERRLKRLEQKLRDAGGRGVDLAEEIDDLRIYVATFPYKDEEGGKEITLTVKVRVPDTMRDKDAAALVHRLILCGQEEAEDSLDCDVDTSDAEEALELEVISVESAQNR